MVSVIGIDIGGTSIRGALVTRSGKGSHFTRVLVGRNRQPRQIIRILESLVRTLEKSAPGQLSLRPRRGPFGVGVGVPGIVSPSSGRVFASPHFSAWKNFDIRRQLSARLRTPVVIDNDANMAARGEHWLGAARKWDSFLMLTLGTGIGGAMMIDKKIVHGTSGFTGEFGHLVIETEGPPCACGSRGCLETFFSATAALRLIREELRAEKKRDHKMWRSILAGEGALAGYRLAAFAKKGNRSAREIYTRMGTFLGIGLASLVNVTGIQKIVLGGGLMGAKGLFLPSTLREMKRRTYKKTAAGIEVVAAQLEDSAGIFGAARAALDR